MRITAHRGGVNVASSLRAPVIASRTTMHGAPHAVPQSEPAMTSSSISQDPAVPTVIVRSRAGSSKTGWFGLAAVVIAHVLALYFLLQYAPAREALTSLAPIMVDLITPPRIEEAPPPPPPPPPPRAQPKPRLEPLKTAEPPPLIAAPQAAPVDFVAPAAPPAPPMEVAEKPSLDAPTAPPAPVAPVTPPDFGAAYLKNQPPHYPAASRRMAEMGRVLLRVLVSPTGEPDKVELGTSSGFERLDAAALEAVRTWKFVPARQAGRAVAAWVQVPIAFSLFR